MSCKCKVSENIDYIHKHYGADNQRKTTNIKQLVFGRLKNVCVFMLTLPLVPFMFCFNIYKSLTHNTIRISKTIKTPIHVRN